MPAARRGAPGVVAGIALSTPVALWWALGDQSEPGARPFDRPAIDPPEVSPEVTTGFGVAATIVVLAGLAWLVVAARRREIPAPVWTLTAAVMAAGAIVASSGRTMTARTIGANIGAGFVILFALPALVVLSFVIPLAIDAWHQRSIREIDRDP